MHKLKTVKKRLRQCVPVLLALTILVILFAFAAGAFAEAADAARHDGRNAPAKRVEMAFVLDTTGSMTNLIDSAKKKIWAIANVIVDQNQGADIYVGLVGYRDLGDKYVTRHFRLTTDIQSIYAELLEFEAAGGGDAPESVNEALDVAVTRLGWSDKSEVEANRIIFLVGDAPPHMDYQQDRKYPEIIREAARKGIIVNTVQCGATLSTTRFWQEMAELGNGRYMAIPQDGGRIIVIETPYDADILVIQKKLNATVIPYGSVLQQRGVRNKTELITQAAPAAAADMSSYLSKQYKGQSVITGTGDLVADIKDLKTDLSKIKDEELPELLRKMPANERGRYIVAQMAERETLSRELAEKLSLRDTFILEHEAEELKKTGGDSFDLRVSETLREQIK